MTNAVCHYVYALHSRRFTELERYLIPKSDWGRHRSDVTDLLGVPLQADTVLKARFNVLKELASRVERLLREDRGDIREQKEAIVVAPLELEQPSSGLKKLRRLIDQRLPRCSIADVLPDRPQRHPPARPGDALAPEPLDLQAACLNLVTNAVVVLNTRYMGKVIKDLRAEGHDVHHDDVARLWPSRFGHINFLGRYHFDPDKIRVP